MRKKKKKKKNQPDASKGGTFFGNREIDHLKNMSVQCG
jgi:hypothetical protein